MNYIMLKDICAINMGQSPDSNSYNDEGYGLPFFQGNADFGERYPIAKKWCSAPQKIAKPEDILISVRAPIGAVNYAKEKCCIGRGLAAITLDKSKVSKEFIFWLLKSKNQELNNKGVGSTFKSIGRKVLEETLVPDLTKEKQMRYSEILEKLYFIIQSRMLQQKEFDELVKARFIEVFGESDKNTKQFPVRKLNEISSYWNGLTYKPVDTVEDGNGTLVLRSSNIQNGVLAFDDNVYVSCDIKEKLLVQDNDILMCSRNGSAALVGKTALIKGLVEPTTFGAFMMIIRSEYYSYLKTYFEMPFFRSQISTGTSTINQITGKMLNEISLPVPDIGTVKVFEEFVNRIAKSKSVIEKSLKELETLQASLMQKYFS